MPQTNIRKTTKEFIEQARAVHGNYYDYSKVCYEKNNKPVVIVCPIHGEFQQLPTNHLRSQYQLSCLKCSDIEKGKRKAQHAASLFLSKARRRHGDKYDYSKTIYKSATDKVIIICPKHGEFLQKPVEHFIYGCARCAVDSTSEKQRYSTEIIIDKFKEVHGDRYDYSLVNYINYDTKVEIICKAHGVFLQTPSSHIIKKSNCPECSKLVIKEKNTCSLDDFIEKSRKVYGDIFNYDKTVYVSSQTSVIITCEKHGDFTIWPESHYFNKAGCPKCNEHSSVGERNLLNFVNTLGVAYINNDKQLIAPYELDLVIPDKKIAIEYNGIYYHTTLFGKGRYYHLNKTTLCKKVGYDLLHIWEDDWQDKKEIVKSLIKARLGYVDRTIYGRNTVLKEIDCALAKEFLNTNHIQGFVRGSIYIGLYYKEELVGVSVFSNYKDFMKLERHACLLNNRVLGALGKITKYVFSIYNKKIITFCDISMFTGKSYESAGFKKDKILLPDYSYVIRGKRSHKFNFRKKIFENRYKLNIENKTEEDLRNELGLRKIYDCGKIKYVYNGNIL